ncbi:MAG: ATP-binding protein [Ardenticatenaceae bacterium]
MINTRATVYSSISTTHHESRLDSGSLVEQWVGILEAHSHPRQKNISIRDPSMLQDRFRKRLSELLENVPTALPLNEMQEQRIAVAGRQIVQLGIEAGADSSQSIAMVQGMLVSWLADTVEPDLLGAVVSAFSCGVYQALEEQALPKPERSFFQPFDLNPSPPSHLNGHSAVRFSSLSRRISKSEEIMIDEEDNTTWLTERSNMAHSMPHKTTLPLYIGGDSFGELILEDEPDHQWSDEEATLINVVAQQMSQALEKAWLFQESQRRAAQLEAAGQVSRAASSLLALEELMDKAVNQIRHAFGYYHAQVFLLDEKRQWALLRASTGQAGQQLLARQHKLAVGSQSTIGQVTMTGEPIVVRDTDQGSAPWIFNELLQETRAELAVPLRVGDVVIGALDVQSVKPDVFYKDDIAVLQTLADQMAVAIQNARAFEQQLETAEKLREVDKLKTQFLANMSHELRTPLNSIIGFSRVILKGIDGPLTELQHKDLTTIYNSGQILLQLIDSILDISKIEAGKMELDFEPVDLRQIIDVALGTAHGLIKDKPIKLVREVPPDLPKIRADKVRLRQILLNLLSNAAKFTEEGRIRLSVTNLGHEVMISVADSGLGIPKEKQKKLFDAFYQVDGSATRKAGGTGLGLAITKSFVALHNGEIWVESSGMRGMGSTFFVTLPIKGPSTTKEEPPEPPLVLAIDDALGMTLLYERYLEPEGYRFMACHDPREAIKMATALQPEVILIDFNMPHMNGLEVIEALHNHYPTNHIPLILYSIKSAAEIKQKALQAGASDFLQKPVLRQDLVSTVQRLINKE